MFFKDKELVERTEKLAFEIDELKSQIKAKDLSGIRKDHTNLYEEQEKLTNITSELVKKLREVPAITDSTINLRMKSYYEKMDTIEKKINKIDGFFKRFSSALNVSSSEESFSEQDPAIPVRKSLENHIVKSSLSRGAKAGYKWTEARRAAHSRAWYAKHDKLKAEASKDSIYTAGSVKGFNDTSASHYIPVWPDYFKANEHLFLRTTEIELNYAPINQYFLHKWDHLIPMYITPRNGWRVYLKKDIEEIHQAIKDGNLEQKLKQIVERPRAYESIGK